MTMQILLLLFVIAAAVLLFSLEQLPAEVIAMGVLLVLVLTGLLPPDQAFAGFGSDTVIMIFGLLVLTAALIHTGVVEIVGRELVRFTGDKPRRLLGVIMIVATTLSAFISNTATAALFVPVTLDLARRAKVSASQLLMPLAFAAILASSVTVVSSSTNILISGLMKTHGMLPLGMFELAAVGIPIAVIGVLYMLMIGHRLIPDRGTPVDLEDMFDIQPYLSEVRIRPRSSLVGKTLAEAGLGHDMDITVLRVVRDKNRYLVPQADLRLEQGDELLVKGPRNQILRFKLDHSVPSPMTMPPAYVQELNGIVAQFSDVVQSSGSAAANRFNLSLQNVRDYVGAIRGNVLDKKQLVQSLEELDVHMEAESPEVVRSLADSMQNLDRFLAAQDIDPAIPQVGEVYDPAVHGEVVRWDASDFIEEGHIIRRVRRGYRDKRSGAVLVQPQVVVSSGAAGLGLTGDASDSSPTAALKESSASSRSGRARPGRRESGDGSPRSGERIQTEDIQLVEVILLPRSPLIGRTLNGLDFRHRYGLQVLGLNRRGKSIYRSLSEVVLRTGDELLVQGSRTNIVALDRENAFRVIGAVDVQHINRQRAPIAVAIFAGVLALAGLDLFPLTVAVWLGALFAFVTNCVTPDVAYRTVEWKALIVIGSMLAIGSAMEYTGTAEYLATQIAALTSQASPVQLLSIFFGLTMLLTQPMSNQAAAVIVLPVALETAARLGLNPRTFAVMIAVGASCSFITPLEPACLMVYGPGRYRFFDFVKVGSVLTVLIYLVAIVLVPWFWPL